MLLVIRDRTTDEITLYWRYIYKRQYNHITKIKSV